ncbi:hypothetical protein CGCF415_v009851 [Colletotrichum fructicola]|nr:hypothetical protein CGCF415_v009851 [Colletotrichum fructicola]KAF4931307.1 hypothetical protein CGCF245_v011228 [Colletotrichum fructicola]
MYFGVFSFGFVACTTILGQQLESHTPFGPIITDTSRANNILPPAAGFLSSILIVNIPHVLLSCCSQMAITHYALLGRRAIRYQLIVSSYDTNTAFL